MSVVNKEEFICDNCGEKSVKIANQIYFGGGPLQGWLKVIIHRGVFDYSLKKNYDFCSKECLTEYLKKHHF